MSILKEPAGAFLFLAFLQYFATVLEAQKDIFLNSSELDTFLIKYFSYYNTLNEDWKFIFRNRVVEFARSKWFVPQKGLEIDNRVKAIISASAIQLTLGLKDWKIGYFDTIIVFPADFTNALSGLTLKGETNLNGFVSFSWKSFIEGYRVPNDNLNLGLHEFTHALRFNSIRGHDSDEFFNSYFPKWYAFANREFKKLKKGEDSIFRKYGGANINEFLSVVIEHFFESPNEFRKQLPLFYSVTAILLNQKTDGNTTSVDIRRQELKTQENLFGLSDLPLYRPRFIPSASIFCFALTVFTAISAGVFSFPTLCLLAITGFLFLKSDYTYSYFTVQDNKINLSKGYLLFRNREQYTIGLPQLMWSQFENADSETSSVVFNYFHNDGFYEEELYYDMNKEDVKRFVSELKKGFVWVK